MELAVFEKLFRNKKRATLLLTLLFCFSLILLYVSSGLTSFGKVEQLSDNLAQRSEFDETGTINLAIKGNNKSDIDPIRYTPICSSQNGLLYSTEPFQNALAFNSLKDHEFDIVDLDNLGDNCTAIVSSIFSNHYDKKEKVIFDTYYIELMFKQGLSDRTNVDNFCYISDIQAKYLMEKNSFSDYKDVIGTVLSVKIDSQLYKWKIGNIFYSSGRLCENCSYLFQNFVISYIGTPYNEIEFIQSFQKNAVHNVDKINGIVSEFPNNRFSFHSINGADDICAKLNSNYLHSTDVVSIILLAIGATMFFGLLLIVVLNKIYQDNQTVVSVLLSSVTIYLICFLIYKIIKSAFIFTTLPLIFNIVLIVACLATIGLTRFREFLR